MTGEQTLTFGKYAGKTLSQVPEDYLRWLANPEFKTESKFRVPAEIQEAAKQLLGATTWVKNRLRGDVDPGGQTLYVIERLGDLEGLTGHESLEAALAQLCIEYPRDPSGERRTPDPEDDRILIWEVLPSGHKKVMWHFSGWHYDVNEFGLEQGSLPGDSWPLYTLAMSY